MPPEWIKKFKKVKLFYYFLAPAPSCRRYGNLLSHRRNEKPMAAVTLYHNPNCSKSRQTLALLQDREVTINLVEYLKQPPTAAELRQLLNALGLNARQLIRTKEAVYLELNLEDTALTEATLINAMVENPILIERPIALTTQGAVIGRPPENVLTLL